MAHACMRNSREFGALHAEAALAAPAGGALAVRWFFSAPALRNSSRKDCRWPRPTGETSWFCRVFLKQNVDVTLGPQKACGKNRGRTVTGIACHRVSGALSNDCAARTGAQQTAAPFGYPSLDPALDGPLSGLTVGAADACARDAPGQSAAESER